MAKRIKPLPYYTLLASYGEKEDAAWLRNKFVPRIRQRFKDHHLAGFKHGHIVRAVKQYKQEYPVFIRLDIAKFYPSIRIEKMLPHIALAYKELHGLSYIPRSFKDRLFRVATPFIRRLPVASGLPLGNPLSAIMAQTMLFSLWIDLKRRFNVPALIFMDDFLIFARNESDAEYIYQHIQSYLFEEYALQLNLEKSISGRFSRQSFDFCGWHFSGGYARISEAKIERFKDGITQTLQKALMSQKCLRASIKLINRKIDGFGNYYKFGNVMKQFEALDKYVRRELREFISKHPADSGKCYTLSQLENLGLHSLTNCYTTCHLMPSKVLKQPKIASREYYQKEINPHSAMDNITDYLRIIQEQNTQIVGSLRELCYLIRHPHLI